MKDCTKEPCCNTCKHSSLRFNSILRKCAIDKDPYANYFGGHMPDYLCDKFEAVDWFCADGERKSE